MQLTLVQESEYARESLGLISSGEMGYCTSVAAYNPMSNTAYMVHMPPRSDFHGLEGFLSMVQEDCFGIIQPVRLYLAGNRIDTSDNWEDIEAVKMERERLRNVLLQRGFEKKQIKSKWGRSGKLQTMDVDSSTGKVSFTYSRE